MDIFNRAYLVTEKLKYEDVMRYSQRAADLFREMGDCETDRFCVHASHVHLRQRTEAFLSCTSYLLLSILIDVLTRETSWRLLSKVRGSCGMPRAIVAAHTGNIHCECSHELVVLNMCTDVGTAREATRGCGIVLGGRPAHCKSGSRR